MTKYPDFPWSSEEDDCQMISANQIYKGIKFCLGKQTCELMTKKVM